MGDNTERVTVGYFLVWQESESAAMHCLRKEKSKGVISMSVPMVSQGTAGNTCPFPLHHKSSGGKEVKGWGIPVE